MEEYLKSEGKCLFCGKTFTKAGIHRHVANHLNEKELEGDSGRSFLVKVETNKKRGSSPYFLSLWIDGESKMKDLDTFLRGIWLECCGHLSAFRYPKQGSKPGWSNFDSLNFMPKGFPKKLADGSGDIPMGRKVKDVLYKDLVLDYEYDFGSTTKLSISVMDDYTIKADQKIVLVSRNEPLEILCSLCGKALATQICTACMYDQESMFCNKCAPRHAQKCDVFEDYASLPVANSPRMGVCGYGGGSIDKERDGAYQLYI